ncbi:hypothetical protein ACFWY5_52065, partial [Nonomuraea sp. NPDC059007]|uniref:hypothetical protein n=1 Tax=Nonomuraea sp. NPDC059007 TaxID=3346692 RepID=UPI0036AE9325
MPFRRWGAALVMLLAGTASACSDPPAKITIPEPGVQARRLTLPFDAYNFSPAEVMTLDVAEDLLVRDCMKGRGLAWRALPGPAESESAPPHLRRYGVIEARTAGLFGYHPPPDRPGVAARKADALARLAGATPYVREAARKCLGQARDHLGAGTPKADAAFFNKTIFATFDASQRDERVTRAFGG